MYSLKLVLTEVVGILARMVDSVSTLLPLYMHVYTHAPLATSSRTSIPVTADSLQAPGVC